MRNTLALLLAATDSPAGRLVYEQIERILVAVHDEHHAVERVYTGILGVLLDALAGQIAAEDPLRLRIRLARSSLQAPLSLTELNALAAQLEEWTAQCRDLRLDPASLYASLQPLLQAFAIRTAQPSAPETPTAAAPTERPVQDTDREHLDEKSQVFHSLQATLAEQIEEAMKHHQEFGVLMEIAIADLEDTNQSELGERKQLIAEEMQAFVDKQQRLATELESTYHQLQSAAGDTRLLGDELERVRQLSLTDQLTGIPNRRAFEQRLEDEIARVSRHGGDLAVALIDLDEFKSVNDRYGHSIGDEVLATYAQHIASAFRCHDLVARYGGEEFAVLLPNTDLHGIHRALSKVRARMPGTITARNGTRLHPPTFSAGIARYRPCESRAELVARADAALYQAKEQGRNRIVVASQDAGDGGGNTGEGDTDPARHRWQAEG